jgi:site-specific DNA recombinase
MSTNQISGKKRAAIYTRVSSLHQEREGASLETQEEACRRYCMDQNWEVQEHHVYRETHKRWLLHERPRMTQLREAARQQEFDVIVCYCVDRLSSQDAHVYILDEEFGRAGVSIAFATEDFEQSAVGRFVRSAKVLAAAIEVEKIRERTVRGRIARVKSGKLIPGGKPLYGYQWADERDHKGKLIRGRLVEDQSTAPIVRQIFNRLANGSTLRAIAKELTAAGIPTPTGMNSAWQTSTIARIAHAPGYVGEAYGWGIRKGGTQPQHFDPDKAIVLPVGTIPPLVERNVWDAVQAVMARNKERAVRSAKNPESALLRGGFVRCGHCGMGMYPRPRSNGRIDYVCKSTTGVIRTCPRPTIVTHVLDEAVWKRVCQFLTQPEIVESELRKQKHDGTFDAEMKDIERATKDVARRKATLVHSITLVSEPEAAAPLVAHLNDLARQERALKLEHESLVARVQDWQHHLENLASLAEWCQAVATNLDTFDFKQKRMTLDALGVAATVYRADHNPRFTITAEIAVPTVSTTS